MIAFANAAAIGALAVGSSQAAPRQKTVPVRGYAPVNGLKMYYEIHGRADGRNPPLVLLHGGGSTIDTVMSWRGAFPFSEIALAHWSPAVCPSTAVAWRLRLSSVVQFHTTGG